MNRVKSDGMIPDPAPFVPLPPLTDEYRTVGNNAVLKNHNDFVPTLVKDAVAIGRFVPVVGSVIVIVEGTVAAGKHGVYMIGLVADGNFADAANAHTAYMTSSLVGFFSGDGLGDRTGLDKVRNIIGLARVWRVGSRGFPTSPAGGRMPITTSNIPFPLQGHSQCVPPSSLCSLLPCRWCSDSPRRRPVPMLPCR